MIQRMSHTTVWVLDQEEAKSFYVGKLGFDVRNDVNMGPFRWLTVGPKAQKDLEIVLMLVTPAPMLDAASADVLRALVQKGTFGAGVLETDDCQKTYDELREKGVTFLGPPKQQPYGLEAVMKDNSGNWFSVVQRPK